jgi:hypothetical protein
MIKKFLIALLLLSSAACNAADTYDATTSKLLISQVLVNNTLYKNVVVELGTIVSLAGGEIKTNYSEYNSSTQILSVPVVKVGDLFYTNLLPF